MWKNIPVIRDGSGASSRNAFLVRVLVPLAVVIVLFLIGHRLMAMIVVGIAGAVLLATLLSRTARHGIERAGAWLGYVVGNLLSVVLLGLVYYTVFALVSGVLRLLGRDPLRTALEPETVSYWGQVGKSELPLHRWQFAREPAPHITAGSRNPLWQVARFAVVLFVLNLLLGVILHTTGLGDPQVRDPRVHAAAHQADAWAPKYYKELQRTGRQRYAGFVGWRRFDSTGEYINVVEGIRRSYAGEKRAGAIEVFFFGGSTMWGIGNRDMHTIPSEFARLAEANGIPVRVTNFGESGYVSWQEVLQLSELCALGNAPNLAIFYDGVNDSFVQIQNPSAEPLPQNFSDLASRFEQTNSLTRVLSHYSAVHVLLKHVAARRGRAGARRFEVADLPGTVNELAENAARVYGASADHARRLGTAYGFEVATFWQPCVYTKTPLRVDEEPMREEFGPGMGALYEATTERLRNKTHMITDALDAIEGPVMVDWCHTNESGARAVAAAIYTTVEPILSRLVQDRSEAWTRGSSSQ